MACSVTRNALSIMTEDRIDREWDETGWKVFVRSRWDDKKGAVLDLFDAKSAIILLLQLHIRG